MDRLKFPKYMEKSVNPAKITLFDLKSTDIQMYCLREPDKIPPGQKPSRSFLYPWTKPSSSF